MKITIIGSNKNAANFIENCEYVDEYTKADVVIFSGDVNWRSAIQKFNKIEKDKLVIVMDNSIELFVKKYGGETVDCTVRHLDQTNPIVLLKPNILTEGFVCLKKAIGLKTGRKFVTIDTQNVYVNGQLTPFMGEYLRKNKCTLVTVAENENMPKCMFIQVNPNIFPKSSVSKYINEVICEYMNSR